MELYHGVLARFFTPLDLLAARCSRILQASSAWSGEPAAVARASAVKAWPGVAARVAASFSLRAMTAPAAFLPAVLDGEVAFFSAADRFL